MKPQQALFSTVRDQNLSLKNNSIVNLCHSDGKEDIKGKLEMKE